MIFLIFFFFHEYLNDCAIVIYVLSFKKNETKVEQHLLS